jgi:hypothetical protein
VGTFIIPFRTRNLKNINNRIVITIMNKMPLTTSFLYVVLEKTSRYVDATMFMITLYNYYHDFRGSIQKHHKWRLYLMKFEIDIIIVSKVMGEMGEILCHSKECLYFSASWSYFIVDDMLNAYIQTPTGRRAETWTLARAGHSVLSIRERYTIQSYKYIDINI